MAAPDTCPICGMSITHDAKKCPQCDADLMCFKVLDSLSGSEDGKTRPYPGLKLLHWVHIILLLMLFLIMGMIAAQFFLTKQANSDMKEALSVKMDSCQAGIKNMVSTQLDTFKADMKNTVSEQVKSLQAEARKPERELHFIGYTVKKGDTLWGISKKFYNNGRYYPVLLRFNPHIKADKLRIGSRIRIRILYEDKRKGF